MTDKDDVAVANFWDKYIFILHSKNILPPVDRWYVVRIEEYIAFFKQKLPEKRLRQHTSKDIDEFITYVTHKDHFDSLKFYQLIHALQLLFTHYLHLEWSHEYDWDYVKASQQESPSYHSDLTRQPHPTHSKKCSKENPSSALEHYLPLFNKLTAVIRQRNYSIRTEECYKQWVTRYILFHNGKSPDTMNHTYIVSFLEYLAVNRNVSPSTQNQALCALVFLYTQVLGITLEKFDHFSRAKKLPNLPVVMTQDETNQVLSKMTGVHYLILKNAVAHATT
ncbi:MAG: phage integrase N-terminal SAM-like domain-containing protein [gamma proteobacterium symbiont of Lucinoma myriamae]|nr:phage integrase N-terminal SAM-like domain-containing protein [gamma proteobacterium symbiont of Lucinoma myriamae]